MFKFLKNFFEIETKVKAEIGKRYIMETKDPFSTPMKVKILDIKNNYVLFETDRATSSMYLPYFEKVFKEDENEYSTD